MISKLLHALDLGGLKTSDPNIDGPKIKILDLQCL